MISEFTMRVTVKLWLAPVVRVYLLVSAFFNVDPSQRILSILFECGIDAKVLVN